ncbi:helix-turn-helix domain-containing protein [Pseudomonas sp. C2B4]|uniref:helix-turn-helix domain-containing protein n=1 Tax=Pseudomonas sp. C2B4 TaxID=2735270 RepID=UPI001586995C|nr:helix-turn-helix domain-containing protein [Pseudomonas sp. C2B4]NUU36888.1 AraC family transcriptional regulator [Pseudomonas sp. C2B4]
MSTITPDEVFHLTSTPMGPADQTIGQWKVNLIPEEHEASIRQYKIIHSPTLQCSRLDFDSAVTLVSTVPHGFVTLAISQAPIGRPSVNNRELRPNEVIVLYSNEPLHYTCEPNETLFTLTTTLEHYAQCFERHSTIDVLTHRKNHSFQVANFKQMESAVQAINAYFIDTHGAAARQRSDIETLDLESDLLISLLQSLTPAGRSTLKVPTRKMIALEAMDYIHENTKKTLSMKSLVKQLETTTRSLHLGFMDAFGISPIAYIRNLRLANVRRDLIRNTWPTVTETAMYWNFHHLGRFSKAYQNAYGETPSETAKRNKSGDLHRLLHSQGDKHAL